MWAGLHHDKIVDCSGRHDFSGAELVVVLSRCEKEPKCTQEVFPSWASPLCPSLEQVGRSGAVEDCPLLVRIGGALSLAGGWVFRLKRLPCVKGAAPKGLRDCLLRLMHRRNRASSLALPLGELSPQVTERASGRMFCGNAWVF